MKPWIPALGLVLAACSSSDEPPAGGGGGGDTRPCTGSVIAEGTFDFSFEGVQYQYIVHLPPSYDGTKRTPLVLNWHGLTSQATEQAVFSGMNPVADENGLIIVYPNSPDKSWNAGTCCPVAGAQTRNDVGFARALVEKVQADACIDSKRIYSMGMSNGAFMSYRLACEASDVFAAIAPVAGKVGIASCTPSRPVPVLAFHGTADSLVRYDAPTLSAEGKTVPDTVAAWAQRNTCTAGPTETFTNGVVSCQTWSSCAGGTEVQLCTEAGVGHCWPGTAFCPFGAYTMDIDGSRAIAAFFARFTMP